MDEKAGPGETDKVPGMYEDRKVMAEKFWLWTETIYAAGGSGEIKQDEEVIAHGL